MESPTSCPNLAECWQCHGGETRVLKMMYELNVLPLGEIYEATAPVEDHVFRERITSSNGHRTKGFLGVEKDNARTLKQDVVLPVSMTLSEELSSSFNRGGSMSFVEVELDFLMTGVNSKLSKSSEGSDLTKNFKSSKTSKSKSSKTSKKNKIRRVQAKLRRAIKVCRAIQVCRACLAT